MNETIQKHLSGLTQGPQATPPAAGLTRVQNSMSTPVVCKECGSEWFFVASLNKYANMYSATPGGDLHALSQDQTIRICMCGAIYDPNIGGVKGGRTPNGILNDFLTTITRVKAHRASLAENVMGLAGVATPLAETAALKDRVEILEVKLAALAAAAEVQAEPATPEAEAEAPKKRAAKKTPVTPDVPKEA